MAQYRIYPQDLTDNGDGTLQEFTNVRGPGKLSLSRLTNGRKVIELETSQSGIGYFQWDGVTSAVQDVEIFVVVERLGSGSVEIVGTRLNKDGSTPPNVNAYGLGEVSSDNAQGTYLLENDNRSTISSIGDLHYDGKKAYRVQAIGDQLKTKTWQLPDQEPSSWELTTTDTTLTDGLPLVLPVSKPGHRIYFIGVGTAGDSAPKSNFTFYNGFVPDGTDVADFEDSTGVIASAKSVTVPETYIDFLKDGIDIANYSPPTKDTLLSISIGEYQLRDGAIVAGDSPSGDDPIIQFERPNDDYNFVSGRGFANRNTKVQAWADENNDGAVILHDGSLNLFLDGQDVAGAGGPDDGLSFFTIFYRESLDLFIVTEHVHSTTSHTDSSFSKTGRKRIGIGSDISSNADWEGEKLVAGKIDYSGFESTFADSVVQSENSGPPALWDRGSTPVITSADIGGVRYQAIATVEPSLDLIVSVRDDGSGSWSPWSSYQVGTLTSDDLHYSPSIQADLDGYLHIAFNNWSNPLTLLRSDAPLDTWTGGTVSPTVNDWVTDKTTYFGFSRDHNGEVLSWHRDEQNTNSCVLGRFDRSAGEWNAHPAGNASGRVAGGSSLRHYPAQKCLVDSNGKHHFFWSTPAANGDIFYAEWTSSGGLKTANGTSKSPPIPHTDSDAKIYQGGLPEYHVRCSLLPDANETPVIYHTDLNDKGEEVLLASELDGSGFTQHELFSKPLELPPFLEARGSFQFIEGNGSVYLGWQEERGGDHVIYSMDASFNLTEEARLPIRTGLTGFDREQLVADGSLTLAGLYIEDWHRQDGSDGFVFTSEII